MKPDSPSEWEHHRRCLKIFKEINKAIDHALELGQVKSYRDRGACALGTNAVTICELVDKENNVLATGYAFCTQQYDRKLGNKIAEGRARKALNG
ncbi:MAG: hypothetical protein V3T23_07160 [Nitrososphaerales archaeon]